jgi:tripartite-type tricarboxylate transporter receptor subunit TctC
MQRLVVQAVGMLAGLVALFGQMPAHAATVEDFYHGRTVTILIGYSVGGGYDTYGRTLARFIGKHIPGAPSVIAENMPGAGSLKAANYLYEVAPKDGTVFGIFTRGMAMEPLLGNPAARFDATRFTWIGSIANEASVCVSRVDSPIATWDDVLHHDFTVSGEGSGSDPDIFALMLKNVLGAHIRLVTGYPGTGEMTLALERGEVMGRCGWSWSSLKAERPDWLADHKLHFLAQMAMVANPELPGVPLIVDLAPSEPQRAVLRLILSRQVLGRPFAGPPGVPAERAAALRQAFDDTMTDPDFLATARQLGLEVSPASGQALQALVAGLYTTPPAVLAQARTAIGR